MILAEKITVLRKRNGWSQEDLAEKLGVSRQSISKWESAQSTPDLNRILAMSALFDVSTDTLLKDEEELQELPALTGGAELNAEVMTPAKEIPEPLRSVSMEAANRYLQLKAVASGRIAIGVMLCILSPVLLILLSGAQEMKKISLSEAQAAGIGVLVLMVMVGTAVGIFIYYGMQMKPFDYMDKEALETEYGVEGMVRDRMERYNPSHVRFMIIGVLLCVLSCVPIFTAMILGENEWYLIIGVCLLLIMVAVGVLLIVRTNIIMEAMASLLEEGEFSRENKRESRRNEAIMTIYWLTAIAIFLAYSFLTNRWDRSWIIWPVAGIGCGILTAVLKVVRSRA